MKFNYNWNVNVERTYWNKSIETIRWNNRGNPLDVLKWVNSIFVNGDVADRFAKPWLKSFDESRFHPITQENIDKKLKWVRSIFSVNTEGILASGKE